ncbi:MAG: Rv2175c family DNA-binding protein [Rhodococcus sp. (in: high G+C Gram-positive bacteria)]
MSALPYCDDVLPADEVLLPLPDAAETLDIAVTRLQQLIREHKLIAVRRDRIVCVPEKFIGSDGQPLKHLAGAIAVLLDGGYGHPAILRWLFTPDDSLPGTPVDVLRGDHAREIIRRAQAMAF